MNNVALRALCLCDGYGGFELGLRLAGVNVRTVARVERDSYAAAVLVARMGETHLDQAPVWDDLTTFDGTAWRGCVDILTAGFPCQPFSQAGQRKGTDDERWLWPAIGRIIRDVGPRFVFLENVPGLVRAGLPHVLADLADLGFHAEWGLHSAADVGAPHKRERIWILAHTEGSGWHGGQRDAVDAGQPSGRARTTQGASSDVVDADSRTSSRISSHDQAGGLPVADTEGVGDESGERSRPWAGGRIKGLETSRGTFPPRPDDLDGWDRWRAAGGPEPSVRRGPDGRPVGLADALHLGGNGLVPRVAASAFAQLLARLEGGMT